MLEERILAYLAARPQETVSGAEMAEAFGVSRNAIWKGVKRLQDKGYALASKDRAGYVLEEAMDILIPERVEAYLAEDHPFDFYYESAPSSTNDVAKAMAEEGCPAGRVVLADRQNAGRGRMGRPFYSPAGTGLYVSLVLRPQTDPSLSGLLTVAAAVAVAEAAEAMTDHTVGIKWVNDCFIGPRKFAGILTEAALSLEDISLRYAVVGVGVNMYDPKDGYPTDLRRPATALFEGQKPIQDQRAEFCARLLSRLWAYAQDLEGRPFLQAYEDRLNMLHQPLVVRQGGETYDAMAYGIDDQARLLVEDRQGKRHVLSGGEIRLKA